MLCFPISIFPSFCFICSNTISFSHQTRNLDFAMNNILVLLSLAPFLYLSQLFGHGRALLSRWQATFSSPWCWCWCSWRWPYQSMRKRNGPGRSRMAVVEEQQQTETRRIECVVTSSRSRIRNDSAVTPPTTGNSISNRTLGMNGKGERRREVIYAIMFTLLIKGNFCYYKQ